MRAYVTETATAAGTLAAIGVGIPLVAALISPLVLPVVVAGLLGWAALALRR